MREACFWLWATKPGDEAGVDDVYIGGGDCGEGHADADAEEGEACDSCGPVAGLLVDDGVGCEVEVEDAVDEGHVEGEEEEDGLGAEHEPWADEAVAELFLGAVAGGDFACAAEFAGLLLQEICRVCLGEEEDDCGVDDAADDEDDPEVPAPGGVLRDEAAHDRGGYRAEEAARGEEGHGHGAVALRPDIGDGAA